jgi:hypothetical protein
VLSLADSSAGSSLWSILIGSSSVGASQYGGFLLAVFAQGDVLNGLFLLAVLRKGCHVRTVLIGCFCAGAVGVRTIL